jgi:hypothetical protein
METNETIEFHFEGKETAYAFYHTYLKAVKVKKGD